MLIILWGCIIFLKTMFLHLYERVCWSVLTKEYTLLKFLNGYVVGLPVLNMAHD